MTAELGFHELDNGLRMGVLKWADFHKDYVGLRLKSEQVCSESTPWSIRNIVGLHWLLGVACLIFGMLHMWLLPL